MNGVHVRAKGTEVDERIHASLGELAATLHAEEGIYARGVEDGDSTEDLVGNHLDGLRKRWLREDGLAGEMGFGVWLWIWGGRQLNHVVGSGLFCFIFFWVWKPGWMLGITTGIVADSLLVNKLVGHLGSLVVMRREMKDCCSDRAVSRCYQPPQARWEVPQGGVSETGATRRMNVRARDPDVVIQMAKARAGGANERRGWDDMEKERKRERGRDNEVKTEVRRRRVMREWRTRHR